MYLKDEELKNANIIKNGIDKNFQNISYDLRINEIIWGENKKNKYYDLKPAESVFVSTIETIELSNNKIGRVIIRNSAIRLGLDIASPIYQPGHKTRVFFRITNLSSDVIKLEREQSVSSLMIYAFDSDSNKPYDGVYADEFDYKGVGDFHAVNIPGSASFSNKIKDLEALEKQLYGNVMLMLTIFVAIFSLVNLNAVTIKNTYTLNEILAFNFVFVSVISILVLLIAFVIERIKGRRALYLTAIPIISFLISVFFWWHK